MLIESNAENVNLSLTGSGFASPIIYINTNEIAASVSNCGGSVTKQFSISNSGQADLSFSIKSSDSTL